MFPSDILNTPVNKFGDKKQSTPVNPSDILNQSILSPDVAQGAINIRQTLLGKNRREKLADIQSQKQQTLTPTAARDAILEQETRAGAFSTGILPGASNNVSTAKGFNRFLDTTGIDPAPVLSSGARVSSAIKRGVSNLLPAKSPFAENTIGREIKDAASDVRRVVDDALGFNYTRLSNINQETADRMVKVEFDINTKLAQREQASAPLLKAITDIKKKDKQDYFELSKALFNSDDTTARSVLRKYNAEDSLDSTRKVLAEILDDWRTVSDDVSEIQNYFPRRVKDLDGYLDYTHTKYDSGELHRVLKEYAKKQNIRVPDIPKEKQVSLINNFLRGTGQSPAKPGNLKQRVVQEINSDNAGFYAPAEEALGGYIRSMTDAIESRKAFGKGDSIEGSIGDYVSRLALGKKISPSQQQELQTILGARFSFAEQSPFISSMRNLGYATTMNSVISTITQLGDFAISGTFNGLRNTVRGLYKKPITRAELGIDSIAQEFIDPTASGRLVQRVFDATGLSLAAKMSQEATINGAFFKFIKLARKNDPDFMKQLKRVFGDEADQVHKELLEEKNTYNTRLLTFTELMKQQPIAKFDMPVAYQKSARLRWLYQLKTYQLKLFDLYRREIIADVASGDRQRAIKGIRKFIRFGLMLYMFNATAEQIKDIILRREYSPSDQFYENIIKLAGFSSYDIYVAKQEGLGSAAARKILPPAALIDLITKDAVRGTENGAESVQLIPILGKPYYWWFGKGTTKSTSLLKTPDSSERSRPQRPQRPQRQRPQRPTR